MNKHMKALKRKVKLILTDKCIHYYRTSHQKHAKYIPVLAFHRFTDKKNDEKYCNDRWYGDIDLFEKQICWLIKDGYHFLKIDEFYAWYMHEIELPEKSVLLTFDDGDVSQMELVEPILRKYNVTGVCFVIGKHWDGSNSKRIDADEDDLEYFSKESVKENCSLECQAHTYDMHFKKDDKAAAEILSAREIHEDFEKMQKFGFKYFSAPYTAYGQYFDEYIKEYYKLGFAVDYYKMNQYVTRKSNKCRINRIYIDGNTTMEQFQQYFKR